MVEWVDGDREIGNATHGGVLFILCTLYILDVTQTETKPLSLYRKEYYTRGPSFRIDFTLKN